MCEPQSFESVWLHHRANTLNGEIRIFIADSAGNPKPWREVETWMQILCYGTSTLPVSATLADQSFGQLPAGVVVPFAPIDLMKSFQFSGFYW